MADITVGGLSSLIHVEKTERYEHQNLVVQVIKTKQSNTTSSLELHLSDKEHIFVGIIKITDPSLVPLYSIVRLKDFSINYPKRFLSILDFQVLDRSPTEIIISGKNLSYHPVYKKQQDQNQNQQPQQQQQQVQQQQQQQVQQRVFKPNANSTPTKGLPIPKSTQGTRQPQTSSSSYNSNRATVDPESLRNTPITDISSIASGPHKTSAIKVIVMSRMQIKEWNKGDNNSGRLFSVILQDGTSEIKATCFTSTTNELSNFDQLYSQFEEKKVLIIQNFTAKQANQEYNKLNHPCELTFNSSTVVLPIEEEIEVPYTFTPIAQLQSTDSGFYDVIGVITDCNLNQTIISKAGNQLTKTNFNITDSTGTIEVIFWNEKANIQAGNGDILSIKSAKLNEFNGNKTLSASFCEINNFTIQEAAQLKQQRETGVLFSGPSLSKNYNPSNNYTNVEIPLYVLKTLPEDSPLFKSNQTKEDSNKIQYRIIGHLFRIPPYIRNQQNSTSEMDGKKYLEWSYDACTKCKKSENSHQNQICEGTSYEKSYKMQFKLADESENVQIDVLGATCQKFLGVSAADLDNYSQDDINKLFSSVLGSLYEVSIQISTYTSKDNITYRRYNATQIQKVENDSFIKLIDDSFNQCRLFNQSDYN